MRRYTNYTQRYAPYMFVYLCAYASGLLSVNVCTATQRMSSASVQRQRVSLRRCVFAQQISESLRQIFASQRRYVIRAAFAHVCAVFAQTQRMSLGTWVGLLPLQAYAYVYKYTHTHIYMYISNTIHQCALGFISASCVR